jgi:iron complex transport system substrate-binding protein
MNQEAVAGKRKTILAIAVVAIVAIAIVASVFAFKALAPEEDATIVITDDYNRTVELPGIPDRIVSVAPTPTELLFAVGAGDHVVGVDDYSDYPAAALNITKVGSYTLNIEAIIGLTPDLIVTSDLVPLAQLDQLQDQGIPYVIFAARTLGDVVDDIRLAGNITGHTEQAETLAQSLQGRIDAVTSKTLADGVSTPKVYVEYYPFWTFGPGSFGDHLISLAGGANIAAETSSEYPLLTSEYVISQDPDVIVYTIGVMTTTTADEIASRPGWDTMTAVANGDIYSMDDNLVSRYGPRVVDGLEQLAEIIHPELFI